MLRNNTIIRLLINNHYDRNAPKYIRKLSHSFDYNNLKKQVHQTDNNIGIIDIGSGSGYLTICLAKLLEYYTNKSDNNNINRINNNNMVLGLDHSEILIAQSIQNVIHSNNEYLLNN